jgi:hypothetical protein
MSPVVVDASPNGHAEEHEAAATMATMLSLVSAM